MVRLWQEEMAHHLQIDGARNRQLMRCRCALSRQSAQRRVTAAIGQPPHCLKAGCQGSPTHRVVVNETCPSACDGERGCGQAGTGTWGVNARDWRGCRVALLASKQQMGMSQPGTATCMCRSWLVTCLGLQVAPAGRRQEAICTQTIRVHGGIPIDSAADLQIGICVAHVLQRIGEGHSGRQADRWRFNMKAMAYPHSHADCVGGLTQCHSAPRSTCWQACTAPFQRSSSPGMTAPAPSRCR